MLAVEESRAEPDLVCSSQAELTFCAGDVIIVFGEIDEDGFHYVSTLLWPGFKSLSTLLHAEAVDVNQYLHKESYVYSELGYAPA